MRATIEKLQEVLLAIKDERNRLPEFSAFGDNNWKELDIGIKMIERAIEGTYNSFNFEYEINEYDMAYQVDYWIKNGDDKSDLVSDYC